MPSSCRSCGAAVIWTVTKNSKRMPVDAEPAPGGNVVLVSGNDSPEAMVLSRAEAEARAAEPLYTSHFKTCPNAAEHRK